MYSQHQMGSGRYSIEPISADQGVDVHTHEQMITGNHLSVQSELPSDELSDDRPINITDEFKISTATSSGSPCSNPKQVFEEESANTHYSILCAGQQRLALPPTYQPSKSPYHSFSDLQLLIPNHLPDSAPIHHRHQNSRKEVAPKTGEESWWCTDLNRGSWHYMLRNDETHKQFYEDGIQETLHRPRQQELVCHMHTITFWQCSQICTTASTVSCYRYPEIGAFERRELYVKPFYSLAPE